MRLHLMNVQMQLVRLELLYIIHFSLPVTISTKNPFTLFGKQRNVYIETASKVSYFRRIHVVSIFRASVFFLPHVIVSKLLLDQFHEFSLCL